jgi:arylformamidase
MDAEEATLNSPILHKHLNECPVIFSYGENETTEFKRQTDDYQKTMEEVGIPAILKEIAGRNHFDVILDLADANSWLSQQVLSQMKLN